MFNKNTKLIASFIAMLVAMAICGAASADEFNVKTGDTVEVNSGDVIVVEVPKTKTAVRVRSQIDSSAPVATPVYDEFANQPVAVSEPVDTTSTVELALRATLTPSGPALGGTIGFSYRPADRVRLYTGFNVGKGLIDVSGRTELVTFGFTAGASKLLTRTVEIGVFGMADWAYRDVTHMVSTSFIGAGPGFRVNRFGVFFQAGIMVGGHKKSVGPMELGSTTEAAVGFHF